MLNKQGFDLWANDYDKTVQLSEESNTYPFAGYKKVLGTIFNEVMQTPGSNVLDIGFGTGILTQKLYENGHHMDGIDFSAKMIEIARKKMPAANLIEFDFAMGLPVEVKGQKYDYIISTYALHHLTDERKLEFIKDLLPLLKVGAKVFIGDISFQTRADLEECKQESIAYWDDDEYYFVADEFMHSLNGIVQCEYYSMSHCGGVFILSI
ncbi:class I SAM-dependent methyltransferase [Bacillus sp. FJAT-49736]|uniref:class I SAM-dependent methyltransferase n=1 Tax=Bacillus sp. FJAT-49736 TaxID=2833582 RepID=UPI001BC8CE0D|nr:class I SAM-dependent methyltransferase [Bacillus sp. FJAT-49736]MBS4172836.1 class I SAM-dependent methyltransferase [Bacillus sp. FJAT-49736]